MFIATYLKQTMFLGYIVCRCSLFTICVTCNVIAYVDFVAYFYISTFRRKCAVPNGFVFLQFLDFLLYCYYYYYYYYY